MPSFGSAFTGEDDGSDQPTQNIVTSAASGLNRALFSDPQSRAALLQIGLGLMQPVGFGQTAAGHIGQAIGGGGEAQARIEKEDLAQEQEARKKRTEEEELDIKHELAGYKGRETAAYEKGTETRSAESKAELQRQKDEAAKERLGLKSNAKAAEVMFDYVHGARGIPPPDDDPLVLKYRGKNARQIESIMDAEAAAGGGTPAPAGAGVSKYGPPGTVVRQGGHSYTVQPDGSLR